jgi:hypothetical protein
MKHVIFNSETGETTVVPFTPEEEAAYLARAEKLAANKPTVEELQAQLATLSAQIAELSAEL